MPRTPGETLGDKRPALPPGDAARRDLHLGDREQSDRLAREDAVAPEAPHDGREKPAAAGGRRDLLDLLVAAASEMSVCPPG
ncbi:MULTISPECIES: hypothetical protein [unclassified Streptomyces]|uniref:hypothetical protein n=1 Tax=unclassified Streptomyces TaxID=2593676 RepID=UPI0029BEC9A9|nr:MULTISPECIES: hypothetical protein [unclassified Streptomyces]MDX3768448.1 hypothetical protein [Streptomyces sp. AK08-01B]MDX3817779.1 hypothetical protein [Streptomyces sp. AK08-01A]